jgi:hypothetical protein
MAYEINVAVWLLMAWRRRQWPENENNEIWRRHLQ